MSSPYSAKYDELGNWGRHYSTVRMTLATFFSTLSFGLIQFRWDKPSLGIAAVAFFFAVFGALLFCHFTRLTYNRTKSQRNAYNEMLTAASKPTVEIAPDNFNPWKTTDGYWAGIVFIVVFLAFDIMWVCSVL